MKNIAPARGCAIDCKRTGGDPDEAACPLETLGQRSVARAFGERNPVVGGGGDQAAQAVGTGIIEEGLVSVTIGTSGVVFTASDRYRVEPHGRLHAFCHAVPGKWHLMGAILSAGGSLRWFGDRRIFQIEAGICLAGAIAEMLMQDRGGLIRLLPALPAAWPEGQISGLIARGGFTVALSWQKGQLREASILSQNGGVCRVWLPDGQLLQVLCDGQTVDVSAEPGGICSFQTRAGQVCRLLPSTDQDNPDEPS